MSARETFALPPIRCELALARDVVIALAHTIVWTRALGATTPRDASCERLDARYVACGDPAVDARVRERADALVRWALASGGGETEVSVSFYERAREGRTRGRGVGGGLSAALGPWKGSRECWERWRIGLEIFMGDEMEEEERARARDAVRDQLVGTQRHVLSLVNEMKAHVPPVTTSDVVSFPFEITTPIAREDSPGSFGRDMLKRLANHVSSISPSMI